MSAPTTSPPRTTIDPDTARRLAALQRQLLTIPHVPYPAQPKQQVFLLNLNREVLFGGAAGGGKSIAILMAALQFCHVPGYAAILFRKSYSDLTQPKALMSVAREWLQGNAKWSEIEHTWYIDCPAGGRSTLTFGYLDRENDRLKYQGAAYNFIGFDELTQHKERDYRYLFSRLRRPANSTNRHGSYTPLAAVPSRMRATTNPGGPGHEWVYRRFIKGWEEWRAGRASKPTRDFIPSLLSDNPSLDYDDYLASLMELDPVTREQLLRGDWSIRPDGRLFSRAWFKPVSAPEVPIGTTVRYWDLAATDPEPGRDPDWTAGALVTRSPYGDWFIRDMVRFRANPAKVEETILQTARTDPQGTLTYMEQEPGASGKTVISHYRRLLEGYTFRGNLASGSKITRAQPFASRADAGVVHMVNGSWNDDFLNEIEIFPDGEHDDQVDAVCGAYQVVSRMPAVLATPDGNTQANPWDLSTPESSTYQAPSKTDRSRSSNDPTADVYDKAARAAAEAERKADAEAASATRAAWTM